MKENAFQAPKPTFFFTSHYIFVVCIFFAFTILLASDIILSKSSPCVWIVATFHAQTNAAFAPNMLAQAQVCLVMFLVGAHAHTHTHIPELLLGQGGCVDSRQWLIRQMWHLHRPRHHMSLDHTPLAQEISTCDARPPNESRLSIPQNKPVG